MSGSGSHGPALGTGIVGSGPADARGVDLGEGWKRTSPLGILAQGLRGLGQAILPAAAALFGTRSLGSSLAIAILVVVAVIALNFLITGLGWWKTQYRIGSSDIRLHKGILSRSARSVPFERIQDVSLEQGLIPRLLGLVEVRFETGAGGKDELKLAFVSEAEGEALRQTVRARLADASEPSSVAQIAEASDAEPLFRMRMPRLLLFGVFEFSLVVFAVLAGAAQQFDFLLPFDIWDFDEWEARLAGPGAWLAGLGWASRVVGAALAIAFLGAVGLATGIARTVAREYGFRLDRTPKGFRRRRGLFTRTDVVMPIHRVQALTISTGLLRRRWGWHGLFFISLAQDAGSANHAVAPFARMHEIEPIARVAGFSLPDTQTAWYRPSPRFRTDRAVLSAIVPALGAAVALSLGQELAALGTAILACAFASRHYFLWRYERHALDERQVISRRGWLAPRLKIAARVKLHSVAMVQGPLARRRGYADLRFGLAGGSLRFDGLALEDARRLRSAVLESIAAVDFSNLPQ